MTKKENELTWSDLEIGSMAVEPGNARLYKTGDWRSQRPTYNFERCVKCGTCLTSCPPQYNAIVKLSPPSELPGSK